MADVKPIPDNYPQLVPDLCVDGADAAIGFYRTVFGAFERMRMPEPDGRLGHAEVEIGSAVIMLSDEFPALCRRRGRHGTREQDRSRHPPRRRSG